MRRLPPSKVRGPRGLVSLDLPLGDVRPRRSRATTLASAALVGLACFAVALTLAGCSETETSELRDGGETPADGGGRDASTNLDADVTTDASILDAGFACEGLDERSCSVAPGCVQHYCPTCTGRRFQLCGVEGGPIPDCPRPQCECPELDQLRCEATDGCHGVYVDSNDCGCPTPGCCARFVRCGYGTADCAGLDLSCRAQQPFCDGPYVVSYEGTCYEGCARREDCLPAPVECTAPVPSFPELPRACGSAMDCAFGLRRIDCCGTTRAIGFQVAEVEHFDRAAAICSAQYPDCDCVPRGVETEDGNLAPSRDEVTVDCLNGACTTRMIR